MVVKLVDVVYINQQVLPLVIVEERELDLDPFYQEDLGGPGSGHRGHKGMPGSQGGSVGRGLKVVPNHIWEQAGKRTGFKAVRNTVKKLRTSKVLSASKKTKWFYRIEVEGRLRGFLVGEDAVAKTVLGHGMKPKEGSVEITLERDKELDVRASLGNLLIDEVKARLDTDYGAMDWNVLFEEDPDDALALVIEAKLRQDLVLSLTDYQEDLGGPGSGHHGHKGTKGSQGGSASGTGMGAFGMATPVGEAGVEGSSAMGGALNGETKSVRWEDASYAESADLKAKIIDDLAEDTEIPSYQVSAFVAQWAETSNDDNMRSLAIQQDAAKEFQGVSLSKFTKGKIDRQDELYSQTVQGVMSRYGVSKQEARRQVSEMPVGAQFKPVMGSDKQRTLLRTMYDKTQSELKAEGVKEVRLYRGAGFDKPQSPGSYELETNAISSWSLGESVARSFADDAPNGAVISTVVPVERILSFPTTGLGCLREGEVVVLGGVVGDIGDVT